MPKIIVHIDLNSFFATVEEIMDPTCAGKPLAVGGNSRRGIISTANYEARKYGVHSAMPTYMAKRLCPGLIIKEGQYELYETMSREFFQFVRSYTKIIEVASIDECYCDFTETLKGVKDVPQYFKNMQYDLYKKTKLKCSIGISTNKFLAKMASDYKKPMGITIIRKRDIKDILYPIKIEDMYGIGKATAPRLKKLNINTIGDLAVSDDPDVKKVLGSFYNTAIGWCHGEGDDNIIMEPPERKSLGHARTLDEDINDYEELKQYLSKLTKQVTNECQEARKKGNTVQLQLKDSNFKVISRSLALGGYYNDYKTIYAAALRLFDKNFDGSFIRLIGVTLQNLEDEREINVQMTFFNYGQYEDENRTKLLINEFNRTIKGNVFMRASDVKKDKKDD